MATTYAPIHRQDLIHILDKCIAEIGPAADLNHIDVSNIYDFSRLFSGGFRCIFTGDISRWNVANANNMEGMFACSAFNGCIAAWDVRNVRIMKGMFQSSTFDNDISQWHVDACKDFSNMFALGAFGQDISAWTFSSNARIVQMVDDDTLGRFEHPNHYHWWTLCKSSPPAIPAAWRAHAEISLLAGKGMNLDRHGMALWMARTWAQNQSIETFTLPEGMDNMLFESV